MMLYIISPLYSWFAHQLEQHEAHLEHRGTAWSSVPEPPAAAAPCCLHRQGWEAALPFLTS